MAAGLAAASYPTGDVSEAKLDLAAQVSAHAPQAVMAAKRPLRAGRGPTMASTIEREMAEAGAALRVSLGPLVRPVEGPGSRVVRPQSRL